MFEKILIIQTAFPGDVILTLPLLQVLKKNYPESKIDFLCIPAASVLLKNNLYVNDVIVYDKRNSDSGSFISLMRSLRAGKYDLIISPHRSFRSAIISKLSSAKKTISFDRSSMSFLYDEKVFYKKDIHEILRNLSLLYPIGIKSDKIIRPELFIGKEESDAADNFFFESGIDQNDRIICIAPGSVWFTKRFPKEKFVKVCDLLQSTGSKIILIGGESDKELTGYIYSNSENKNISDAAGKFSILGSAELIRRASLLITNDSAPLHIANAVGTKVIAVFGATVPGFGFYPYGDEDIVIEINGLKCRPCSIHGGNKCPVKTFDCMMEIKENSILESVINSYANKKRTGR